ncbi:MAG: ATP-dependent RNA helicase HrpA [Succinivibrio sp.]|nr:ATP-dependent RNA helicase HrpA [Succinivibrio sp.]
MSQPILHSLKQFYQELCTHSEELLRLDFVRLRAQCVRLQHEKQVQSVRLEELLAAYETARHSYAERLESLPELNYEQSLPVMDRHAEIVAALKEHQVVIIAGETGSGKTTQIPKMCLEAGLGRHGMIGHTQPRRIAARAVAQRIAQELHEGLGQSVGYKVRFTDVVSEHCFIKLMTDGMLLSETAADRRLYAYDCIIIDEAHERSLNIDFLLGYLKQLLVKRPELKLVITSATIDVERFSAHFGNAPVIQVSGRTYPVELVYLDEQSALHADEEGSDEDEQESYDLKHSVLRALQYLYHNHGRGDTLVFLPGEHEIRDLHLFLNRQKLPGVEVLPLYARLAFSEQNRIFEPHTQTRVVLATNVAETSLTVPNIRYVIDPGKARISRYSPRTKVQRLPIENISKASANQRAGRCGRVMSGVCVRLYSEADFEGRPEFTDPEILRTNLAAVILQMVALHLGDVESFPFLDAPQPRQITDGLRLLEELGALEKARGKQTSELRLTEIGLRLARLPCDPRLGRMLLEADRYRCLSELLLIVSGLSVLDPRETPQDKLEASRTQHARFNDEKSDFLSYIKLYQYIARLQQEQSNTQYKRTLKKEFISYLRVREWFDVLRQLRSTCQVLKLKFNDRPGDYESIHRSILTGLLSQIGMLDDNEKNVYLGARGVKFYLHPSSVLAKKHPKWICASELSETSRLFARTLAEIDPSWVEWAGAHLIKKSYTEPHWSKKQGAVLAHLNITLYGLMVVRDRLCQYSKVDPPFCHSLLVREGLVAGELNGSYSFLDHNRELIESVEHVEDKLRRRDLLVDEETLADFYTGLVPAKICTERDFKHWWDRLEHKEREKLNFKLEQVVTAKYQDQQDKLYPESWVQGKFTLPLSYVFKPADPYDGVSVHIPVSILNQVKGDDFLWQVPGLRADFFTALIKSLPKRLRKNLIPAPEFAVALQEALADKQGQALYESASRSLTRMGGEVVQPEDFDLTTIPEHLFITFIVEDLKGQELMHGKNLRELQNRLQQKTQSALQTLANTRRQQPATDSWSFGSIARFKQQKHGALEFTVYPALTEKSSGVSLEVYDTQEQQQRVMWRGQRRLLFLNLKQPTTYLGNHLPNKSKLAMYYQPIGSISELIADLTLCSIDALMREAGAPAWNQQEYAALYDYVRANLNAKALEQAALLEQILAQAHELTRLLKGKISLELARTYADVRSQLDSLVYKGFLSETKLEHLKELPRYLEAAKVRLIRAPRDLAKDLNCMRILEDVTTSYENARGHYKKGQEPEALGEVRWMLEELRVSFFAQSLGVKIPISSKRIDNELQRILTETLES